MTATFRQPAAGWVRPPLEGIAGQLATFVIDTVKHAASNAPRSLQASAGPSELGTPCTRKLGYRAVDHDPKPNTDTDPWCSTIGTATHAWLASLFTDLNSHYNPSRFLIEQRVMLPGGIPGNCDLYDRHPGTVIDWKTTGNDSLKTYRRDGPGPQYRTQAHLYGLGMQLAGEHPRDVAIVFLPRSGRLDSLHVWSEPYDPLIAVQALKRFESVRQFHASLDPETWAGRWALLPTADAHCTYCPWYLPGSADLSQGCPGHNPSKEK